MVCGARDEDLRQRDPITPALAPRSPVRIEVLRRDPVRLEQALEAPMIRTARRHAEPAEDSRQALRALDSSSNLRLGVAACPFHATNISSCPGRKTAANVNACASWGAWIRTRTRTSKVSCAAVTPLPSALETAALRTLTDRPRHRRATDAPRHPCATTQRLPCCRYTTPQCKGMPARWTLIHRPPARDPYSWLRPEARDRGRPVTCPVR
jgi:hypothetical protein